MKSTTGKAALAIIFTLLSGVCAAKGGSSIDEKYLQRRAVTKSLSLLTAEERSQVISQNVSIEPTSHFAHVTFQTKVGGEIRFSCSWWVHNINVRGHIVAEWVPRCGRL